MSTFLIAEAASCHDMNWRKARALIDLAAASGWDACKFQFWSDADRLADRRKVPDYYRRIYHEYQMPVGWLERLKSACDGAGLEFMCTTYLPEDIEVVAPYVSRFKVSSFEAMDFSFLQDHYSDKPILVSTGMLNEDEIRKLMSWPGPRQLLHCISSYPAPLDSTNLRAGLAVCEGLSDHTAHPLTGAVAVGAGATIIEAHIRLHDTSPQNPDFACALSPKLAHEYVRNVRLAERMMGTGEKRLQECEREMARYRVKP